MDRCPWNPAAMVSTIGHLGRLERDVGVPLGSEFDKSWL